MRFNSLYRQATIGDAHDANQSGLIDKVWEGWMALKGTTSDDARKQYVDLLDSFAPSWEFDPIINKTQSQQQGQSLQGHLKSDYKPTFEEPSVTQPSSFSNIKGPFSSDLLNQGLGRSVEQPSGTPTVVPSVSIPRSDVPHQTELRDPYRRDL